MEEEKKDEIFEVEKNLIEGPLEVTEQLPRVEETKVEEVKVPIANIAVEEAKTKPEKESSIRTYANDISDLIRRGATISGIALSEQERKYSNPEYKNKVSLKREGKNFRGLMIVGASIFIILGVLAIVGSFLSDKPEEEMGLETLVPSIIFSNSQKEIILEKIDRAEILKKIAQERSGLESPLGAIVNLYFTIPTTSGNKIIASESFLKEVAQRALDSFTRSFEKDFMLGLHAFDGNQAFLILKVKSFDNAFSGILNWEGAMLDDIWPIFFSSKPTITAPGEKIGLSNFSGKFEDVIIKNRDARVLKDLSGEVVIIYSFPDKKHLIITTEISTLVEVFERLTGGR